MDKLKNLVPNKDTQDVEATTRSTGRLTGQGSHFPKTEDQPVEVPTRSGADATAGYLPGTDAKHGDEPAQINPSSGLSGPGSGSAAIGETSTYSSHTLRRGDEVPSVIDPKSSDPTTYQMPEHSYASSKGVPEGGPLAAAAAAFHKDRDYSTSHIPGAFPSESAYESVTINPDRSTETAKVPDASAAAQSATTAAAANRDPTSEEPKQTTTVGKILGAVGLGTAAAGAGVAASRAKEDTPPTASAPSQPTTTTGVDSYTAPTLSTAPGETALPQEREKEDHTRRNAGLAAAGAGAGVGALAYGVHEHDKNKAFDSSRKTIPNEPAAAQASTTTSTVPSDLKKDDFGSEQKMRESQAYNTTDDGRDSHGYGKTAAAAGVGAGAGAAGAYALHEKQPGTERSDWPLSDDSTTQPTTAAAPTTQPESARQGALYGGAPGTTADESASSKYSQDDTRAEQDAQKPKHRKEEAALAGAAGVGAGAVGMHEFSKHQGDLDEDAARRQKDFAEQEEARRKQFEKDSKAAEKQAKKEERQQAKEEKRHQKEVEKEEKKQQKELAKEEKQKGKEIDSEPAAAAYDKQEPSEREEKERREKEALGAAAVVGAGAATGGMAYDAHEKDKRSSFGTTTATDESGHNKLHKDPPEEKKPSLLKRIFRRRKNKDTGEEEEYEDEEGRADEPESEHGDHHLAAASLGAGAGATAAGTVVAASHEPPASSYEEASGGAQKPSYNPFSKDEPASTSGAVPPGTATTTNIATSANDFTSSEHPPYDPTHNAASRDAVTQQGEHFDNIGGPTASHPYAEGEQKPGLAH